MRSYRDVKGDKISIFHSNWKNDKLFTYNGLPRWRGGKESRQCRRLKRCWFDPWVRKIPWSRAWKPTPLSFPRESYGQKSLAGYSPSGRKELYTNEVT